MLDRRSSRKTAKPKLPFAIAMKDGRPFTFAGLPRKLEGSRIRGMAAHLHDYHGSQNKLASTDSIPVMPAILAEQNRSAWLGETLACRSEQSANRQQNLERLQNYPSM